jgi:hypothetical protein
MEGLSKLASEIQADGGAAGEFLIREDLACRSALSAAALLRGFA